MLFKLKEQLQKIQEEDAILLERLRKEQSELNLLQEKNEDLEFALVKIEQSMESQQPIENEVRKLRSEVFTLEERASALEVDQIRQEEGKLFEIEQLREENKKLQRIFNSVTMCRE